MDIEIKKGILSHTSPQNKNYSHLCSCLAHGVTGVATDFKVPHGVVVCLLVLPHRWVCVAKRPASTTFADLIKELLSDCQVPHVVLDGRGVVFEQGVGVAEGITCLSFDCTVTKFLSKMKCAFVLKVLLVWKWRQKKIILITWAITGSKVYNIMTNWLYSLLSIIQ